MNSAVVQARWSGAPRSAPNMNSTEAGATDSAVAQMRKADQSENHTAPQMARAAASWKPGRIGAGASSLLNRFMASSNARSAARKVDVVGSPAVSVSGNSSQAVRTPAAMIAIAAVAQAERRRCRHSVASPWPTTAKVASGRK